ncbi:MAG: inner-rane translocator [Conexibacter sp.]|nr:inner-rane translocator [Conexibacter sp.]MDX6717321.1 branched-chain amino acid transport system permease protein [Baekduia sp.]MDX6731272.1 branched-chain amino acid transport system permease protein [Baekduia sp.]
MVFAAVDLQYIVQNVIDAVSLGSLYALIALGIALIFGIMQLVNLAYGELIMVAGYLILLLAGAPWPLVVVLAVAGTALFAFGMERVAFRPVRGADATTLMVTSFAVSYVLQNLAIVIAGSEPQPIELGGSLIKPLDVLGIRVPKLDLITMGTSLVLVIGLVLFLKRTSLGIQMRAAAEDLRTARLLGVRVNGVIAAAFIISGLLAAAIALLLVVQTGSVSPMMGVTPLIVGIMAAVIGGMGRLAGAAVGGFLLGCVTIALQATLPADIRGYRDAMVYALIIAVLVFRPQGLLAGRAPRQV